MFDDFYHYAAPHTPSMFPRYPSYSSVYVRRATFEAWTNSFPPVDELVDSGFFFLGGSDNVQCFHCGIILHSWLEDDIPDEEHQLYGSHCPFVLQKLNEGRAFTPPSFSPPAPSTSQFSSQESLPKKRKHSELEEDEEDGELAALRKENLKLREENIKLRERLNCRVCMTEFVSELFLPCAHMGCCSQCSGKLKVCPYCRAKIDRSYKIHIP